MKSIFLLNIFLLFLLTSSFKSKFTLSNDELEEIANGDCTIDKYNKPISIEPTKTDNKIDINNCPDEYNNYIIKLNVSIPKTKNDLLDFELIDSYLENSSISFFLSSTDTKAFIEGKKSIRLKISDIVSGNYYLKITFGFNGSLDNFTLSHSFSNYDNTKRLEDNDEYTLNPDDKRDIIYEYGLSKDKKILFKVLGNSINDFNFKYQINNDNNTIAKSFFKGYSLLIDNSNFKNADKTIKFYFENNQEKLNISTSLQDNTEKKINNSNNHFDIVIMDTSETFNINLNIKDSDKYIFKFTTYTKNINANFIDNNNKIDTFEINEESSYYILNSTYNYKKVTFNKIGNKDLAALSLDVTKLEKNNDFTVIRGLPQRNILYSNMVAIYKTEIYQSGATYAVINSHIIKGELKFYKTNNNKASSDIEIPIINGYASYKYLTNENEPIYAKASCISEECIFDIDLKGEKETTYFKKDYKVFSLLNSSNIDKYQINIKDTESNTYLLINIYYLKEKPNVTIDKISNLDSYKSDLIENVLYYNIPINDIKNKNLENILINIATDNKEGIYYGISYEITTDKNEIYLEQNIVNIINLEKEINSKTFKIKQNSDSKLIINLNTFSNDLTLALDGTTYTPKNNLIYIELDKKTKDEYSFSIKERSYQKNKYINLYIYEQPQDSKDSKIFIQEGIIYNNRLTKENSEINFSIYLPNNSKYLFNFRKYSINEVKITIDNILNTINKISEFINFETKCSEDICEVLIKIELENKKNIESDVDFNFQIIKNGTDINLELYKNIFTSGILEKGINIIYDGIYENNDEIFVDFLEGEGEASLTLWDGYDGDEEKKDFNFDYYNKKFNIEKNSCKSNNCKFKITLSLPGDNKINDKYKYNILLKDPSSYISIPPFETIYGIYNVDYIFREQKYSIKKISNFYNYELDCDFCTFQEETNEGDEIKFSIKLKQIINPDVYYYNFRINFYEEENIIFYHLNSVRNHHYCNISKNNPCYYLAFIEGYNDKVNLIFLAQNGLNIDINLISFKTGETEQDIYTKIKKGEITKYNISSKHYLEFTNTKDSNGYYILLVLKSDNENTMKVNLVYDMFNRNYSNMKNIYKDDFCLINSDMNIELTNTKDEYNILDLNLLNGNNRLEVDIEDKKYYLEKGFKDNLNLFSSFDKSYTIPINVKSTDSIIYYRKIKYGKKANIKEIYFGKSNYLTYENKIENSYFSYYINLNDVNIVNEDIHLNYKILNIHDQNNPDDIKIEIFLVNEDYIINEKKGLNNNNLAYIDLTNITYYQKDIGAGYALLNKNNLIDKNNPYLYIKFNEIPTEELHFVITVTDFSENYDMPKDIYLYMIIKEEKEFEIKQNNETTKIPFVEISYDNNLKVNYNESKLNSTTKNGKTILVLKDEEKIFNFKFTINSYEFENIPNLLIKYGFSSSKDEYSYFNIKDNNITYDDSTKLISFNQLETGESSYSIIYNILIYNTQILYDSFLEKTKPVISLKHIESKSSNEAITIKLTDALNNRFGKYYINILSEGKIKNEAIDNYEYLLYKYSEMEVTTETLETEITITEKKQDKLYDCTNNVKIKASTSIDDSEITQYKFIKLVIIDYNEKHRRQKFEIYASTNESFNSVLKENLYKESEYKSIDSFNNTVLAIPLNKNTAKKLYIYIPCKDQCDFHLQYRVEDGRKMEGISIHENTCFDILLENIVTTEGQNNNNYRFVYTINKTNVPLITLTTDDINHDYELFTSGLEASFLRKSFYNGYAFLFYYSDTAYFEYHTFIIKPNVTTLFKICHRIIDEEKNGERKFRPLSVGENIYSAIKNKMYSLKDCFEIKNEENYTQYMFNYITQTQNMRLVIYKEGKNTTEFYYLFDETGTIFLNATYVKQFCLVFRDGVIDSVTYGDAYGSVNFQILGIKNNTITQSLNAPLINGFSVKHTLQKGQMIYYRLNRYKAESQYLEMYFQGLSGNIALNRAKCDNYPNCSFTPDKFDNIINYFYKNNFYDEQELEDNEKDIYNKEYFSVYLVYCDSASEENCVYYIGMNNENSTLELNEKRKYYFKLTKEKTFYLSTHFYQERYDDGTSYGSPRKYYFEVHSFQGDFSKSNIYINKTNDTSLHNYDNKTYYYSSTRFKFLVGEFHYYINKITAEKNTLFYITYHSLLVLYYEGKVFDNFYCMYENEMHYNLLGPENEEFTYFYPEADTSRDTYIASLSGINSYLYVYGNNLIEKNLQYILKDNYTKVKCYIEEYSKPVYQCEFIFSFAKLIDGAIKKNVEFDGFYQYYILNDENNEDKVIKTVYLRYNLTEIELKQEKVVVTIKKKNLEELKIHYGFNTEDDFKYSRSINKQNEMFRIYLHELKNESNNKLANNFNQDNYLMFKITSNKTTHLYIKINIKNVPTYLNPDEIEYGSLEKNETLYYYFNYFPQENDDVPKNYEEVILYNKGNIKMKAALLENTKDYPYNTYDMYEIIANESSYFTYDIDSENNHIKFKNNKLVKTSSTFCQYGCIAYIKIYLNGSDENTIGNNNLFNLYRHNQNENSLVVELGNNIFGNLYSEDSENYYFYIEFEEIKGNLIVNLDCQNCKMLLYLEKQSEGITLTTSYIFDKTSPIVKEGYINSIITGQKGYYFISFTDSSLPKYIEESVPELCYGSCKFVFPLFNYYNYIKNETEKTQIVFYSPDFERIKISVELIDKWRIDDFPLEDFNLIDKTEPINNENNNFCNRLFYDLNADEVIKTEKYLRIHVVSEDNNKKFNFIMNKFISSINTDTIKYRKQIISLEQGKNKKNIMTINNERSNIFYKISLCLISGEGKIYLDDDEKYQYYLNYEYRPTLSVIIKLQNYNISASNLNKENNFTFFINVTKLDKYENIEEQFDNHQVYKIKYIIDEEKDKLDIFPLNFKVPYRKGYTAFISYRFIELEHKNNDGCIPPENEIYNSTNIDFYVDLNDNMKNSKFNLTNFESTYYPDFQRGIIKINSSQNIELDYINFILNKSKDNNATYKTLFLEVAPIFINNEKQEKIYIPKNVYVQFELNRINQTYELSFYEQNPEYDSYQIDLANSTFLDITNEEKFNFTQGIYFNIGKSIFFNSSKSREKIMYLMPNSSNTILVKYFTKKNTNDIESIPNFMLIKSSVEWNPHDNSTIYNMTQTNIIPTNNSLITDYTISHFIRLYSFLSIYDESEIMNILIPFNGNMSFNIDFNKSMSKKENFDYTLDFGNIKREMYYINLIGAVKLYDSIEYFSYGALHFRLYLDEPQFFEKKWFIPLFFVLLVFCCVIAYSIFINIKEYREKKNKKKEGDGDILINNMEIKNDAEKEEEKEEDKDDENEKEDDNDEDDDDDNKIKI